MMLARDEFDELLKAHHISRRLRRDIRYVPEEISHHDQRDFVVAATKAGSEGILVFERWCMPFTLTKRTASISGRVEAVICDICATWQRGTNSAVITFRKNDKMTASYLVCGGLNCSLHVRDMTDESKLSRTQLREHTSLEQRVNRLHHRLRRMLDAVTA